jgi:hypothetical protein
LRIIERKGPFVPLERLVEIMRRLRDPKTGCEWDSVQTFATIAPYTIEEAYEVVEAFVDGTVCGRSQTIRVGPDIVYSVNVLGSGPGGAPACGSPGKHVEFNVASRPIG